MGATSNNPKTKADKLYAHFLAAPMIEEDWLRFYKRSGFCGPRTDVYFLKEKYLDEAMRIAKSQGINCEPSGVAGLALMLQMKNSLPRNKKMLIVNTGKTKL